MNNYTKLSWLFLAPFLLSFFPYQSGMAATLSEKRQELAGKGQKEGEANIQESLKLLNHDLEEKRNALVALHTEAEELYQNSVAEKKSDQEIEILMKDRLTGIKKTKKELNDLENNWKTMSKGLVETPDEGLWHQPDTSIGQLVIDYGSLDHVYLMPPEIASLKIHVSSQLTVPKASWNEMLELILASYGIGTRQLNPFLRQLFFLRLNVAAPDSLCDSIDTLKTLPLSNRVLFILSPPPTETKRVFQFLEKFVPQEQVAFQLLGSNIVMVGSTKELLELCKIYTFLVSPKQEHGYRLVSLAKAQSEEVAKILQTIFEGDSSGHFSDISSDKRMAFFEGESGSAFRVMSLKHPAQSLFLIGKHDVIDKACEIIRDIEDKIGQAQEKTVFLYACKHSDATDLAKVVSQVYNKMTTMPGAFDKGMSGRKGHDSGPQKRKHQPENEPSQGNRDDILTEDGFLTPPIVGPEWIGSEGPSHKQSGEVAENFIVDQKTNSIIMVVEAFLLDKIKDLLRVIDIPKKMVQIDVLLFEKKITDNNNFGMNLLRLGDAAKGHHRTKLSWNNSGKDGVGGILDFALSRNTSGLLPAYDLAFNFLLSQQDVQINANPTVTTVNQTPAKVAIMDEISINTGTYAEAADNDTRFKNSYVRAQYGITLNITPTIHAEGTSFDENEEKSFITLVTDVMFDTPGRSKDDRPDVIRRNVKNEVRIADGETIILAGLRRKGSSSDQNAIPFLGELPGIGKFFSTTALTDTSTEMFIFITPHIIPNPEDEFHAERKAELLKRPGDIPEFLEEVEIAKQAEHEMLFSKTLRMFFGKTDITHSSRKVAGQ